MKLIPGRLDGVFRHVGWSPLVVPIHLLRPVADFRRPDSLSIKMVGQSHRKCNATQNSPPDAGGSNSSAVSAH